MKGGAIECLPYLAGLQGLKFVLRWNKFDGAGMADAGGVVCAGRAVRCVESGDEAPRDAPVSAASPDPANQQTTTKLREKLYLNLNLNWIRLRRTHPGCLEETSPPEPRDEAAPSAASLPLCWGHLVVSTTHYLLYYSTSIISLFRVEVDGWLDRYTSNCLSTLEASNSCHLFCAQSRSRYAPLV